MTLPPPPSEPDFGHPPASPPGYQGYAVPGGYAPPTRSGLAVAGFVLSLVGVVPCFWFWVLQIPGYLGVILSAVALKQTKGGQRSGRGLALAGLIIGIVVVIIALLITAYVYTSDNCTNDGLFNFECTTDT